jgi:hypothetical protein
MPIFKPQSHQSTVEVDGKEWLQPMGLGSYLSEQVRAVCPAGLCIGNLPGSDINLTGYRWASIEEVIGLYNAYGVDPPFTGPNQIRENQTAADFFDDFDYADDLNTRILFTFARDKNSKDSVYLTVVTDNYPNRELLTFEILRKFSDDINPVSSTWFWRPAE